MPSAAELVLCLPVPCRLLAKLARMGDGVASWQWAHPQIAALVLLGGPKGLAERTCQLLREEVIRHIPALIRIW